MFGLHRHESAEAWKSLENIPAVANALQQVEKIAAAGLVEEQVSAASEHHGIRSCTHRTLLFDHGS